MFEIMKNVWIVNGILAGALTVLIQMIGIFGVVAKMFEKK